MALARMESGSTTVPGLMCMAPRCFLCGRTHHSSAIGIPISNFALIERAVDRVNAEVERSNGCFGDDTGFS